MLYVYTENLFAWSRLKQVIKGLLDRKNRGPQAVFISLAAGLKELGRNFSVNKKIAVPIDTACVLSGIETLNWAITKKQQGKIKKIIAGPNLVVSPNDSNGILKNSLIDTIIVPSQWVKDFYCKIDPTLESLIKVWPAGVELPAKAQTKKVLDFIIYNKLGENSLCLNICQILKHKNYSYKVLSYGNFKQQSYFNFLDEAKYEIYLSQSESQGLAMFEAWARGVPTLVYESGKYQYKNINIGGQVSAPFLSQESGMSFADTEDFKNKLEVFLETKFSPRSYVEENFTNKICSQKYLDIVYGT